MRTTLPTDSNERKEYPLFRGLLRYFPAALAGVARHSKLGNDKHNPGEEMHHARGKSGDHEDCIIRHLTDLADMLAICERRGFMRDGDADAVLAEVNALAWRALALSQEAHELYGAAPLAPGARLPVAEVHRGRDWSTLDDVREAQVLLKAGWPNPRCPFCMNDPCTCPPAG